MFCQLDQVKQILDTAAAVKNVLGEEQTGEGVFARKACSMLYGLLLMKDYDVFIQGGTIHLQDQEYPHQWIEMYLDGVPFILDICLGTVAGLIKDNQEDIYFLPEEDAVMEYGYQVHQEYPWLKGDCQPETWQRVIERLKLPTTVEQLLEEIEENSI
ncbi:hypothetical protein [Desulfotomaculum sp. 1211_IL3151]|uniref:hypothetical protein n=1 Tax=Desulfotomaculum sp. 1211_IL3151 TaxID=3084055 RepID=UPI002FDA8A47